MILLTGVCGFIGSNIADRLVKDGYDVIGVDNLLTGKMENIKQLEIEDNFKFVKGDLADYKTCLEVTKGADVICHQAALPSVPRSVADPIRSNENNVTATVNLLKAAIDNGVGRFIYASSSSIYGDNTLMPKKEDMMPMPKSPYAVSKLTGEYYLSAFCKVYGIDGISLRYFNVFGKRQDPQSAYAAVIPKFMIAACRGQEVIVHGDGNQTRDFSFVGNVVQANMKAIESKNNLGGESVNIACGEKHSIWELIEEIENISTKPITALLQSERAGDVKNSLADITKARKILGYKPEVGFVDGLKETFEYYKGWSDGEGT